MRKAAFINALFSCSTLFCIVLLATASLPAYAQAPASPAMPTDAKQLMQLAAKLNCLTGPDIFPWHLRASYTLYDETGKASDSGTYEEFWARPTKFKRKIVQGSFVQTEFGTGNGVLRSGSSQQPSKFINQMRESIAIPFPSTQAIEQNSFERTEREVAGEKLTCLQFKGMPLPNGFTYCLSRDEPALRAYFSAGESLEVDYSRILKFQEHYVGGDLSILRAGKLAMTAHLDSIDTLDTINEVDFAPTTDAKSLHRRINVSAGVAVMLLQEHGAPTYPIEAKKAGISGTVVLRAVIGVDGLVSDLQVVSGPPELQQAAIDAVRSWRYRPYLLNNEPIEVLTQINIIFTLAR